MTQNPVFCALDTPRVQEAAALARSLAGAVGGIKLGLEFFAANGPAGVREVASALPVFLDLKLHDIPNTVAGAVRATLPLGIAMLTLHASGGREMLRQAAAAAAEAGSARPLLLAVTVLTSLDEDAMGELGFAAGVADTARRLAALAQDSGLDGAVCSAHEVAVLRRQCGAGFRLVVPGIRPAGAEADDQRRVMTPAEALAAGADILVIGRPITGAPAPLAAARAILAGISAR